MINREFALSLKSPLPVLSESRRDEFQRIFSMTRFQEREALYAIARYTYTNEGEIWDIGCAAGGSSYFLGAGLKDSLRPIAAETVKCFDLFNGGSLHLLKNYFPTAKDDLDIFALNTMGVSDCVTPIKMDLLSDFAAHQVTRKVEIAHIDAAKSLPLWKAIFAKLSVNIIPGKTVWIFQDFERARTPWHVYALWELLQFGEILGGARYGTVYFRFRDEISEPVRRKIADDNFSVNERQHNIQSFFDLIREKYRYFFPDEIYKLEDVEAAALAYCHFWNGDLEEARKVFSTTSDSYRAEGSNKIYLDEMYGKVHG